MSINDIYNVASLYRANAYIKVSTTNADKEMGQGQGLFNTSTNSQNSEETFSLFPNLNEYDNAEIAKRKNEGSLFI